MAGSGENRQAIVLILGYTDNEFFLNCQMEDQGQGPRMWVETERNEDKEDFRAILEKAWHHWA
jgi:hypothetical protein